MIQEKYQNFLITSNLDNPFSDIKKNILYKLAESIKHFFPNSFLVISDSSYLPIDIQKVCDFTITDNHNKSFSYHGNSEIHLLNNGLDLLLKYNKEYHYRLGYDFILNQDNLSAYIEWSDKINNDISLIFSKDNGSMNGVKTNIWFGKTEYIKNIIPNSVKHSESEFFNQINNLGLNEKTFYYNNLDEMFHNKSNTYDLIGHAGKTLREEKIEYFNKYYESNRF